MVSWTGETLGGLIGHEVHRITIKCPVLGILWIRDNVSKPDIFLSRGYLNILLLLILCYP